MLLAGVGIDGGNEKNWENNSKKIQLVKTKGKVKALDEEINSTWHQNLLIILLLN